MNYNADNFSRATDSISEHWPRTKHPDWEKGNGSWVLARPIDGSHWWERLKPAWQVLTGKLDTLSWTGQ